MSRGQRVEMLSSHNDASHGAAAFPTSQVQCVAVLKQAGCWEGGQTKPILRSRAFFGRLRTVSNPGTQLCSGSVFFLLATKTCITLNCQLIFSDKKQKQKPELIQKLYSVSSQKGLLRLQPKRFAKAPAKKVCLGSSQKGLLRLQPKRFAKAPAKKVC